MSKFSFDDWKKKVDKIVTERTGLSIDDLPDVNYYSMWESGDSPKEAATEVISYAMEN